VSEFVFCLYQFFDDPSVDQLDLYFVQIYASLLPVDLSHQRVLDFAVN